MVGLEPESISDEYFVPYFTVMRIWNEDSNRNNEDDSVGKSDYWKHIWEEVVLDYFKVFMKKVEYPFISNDISEKLKRIMTIDILVKH